MNKNISPMKTIFRFFACLGVLGILASCQMYEIDTQMTPEQAAASIRMDCDALPSYTVPATDPGTVNFNVSSNTPWTITRSSGADWCTVTPSSSSAGALISDVVVSFEANTAAEDRTATLTLKADKVGVPVTIQITQARQGRLFVTPLPQDFAAVGGPLEFSISTNVDWEIRSSEGWLSFNRSSGAPDPEGRTLTIIATAAQSDVLERSATVTVVAGDEEESFEVSQVGKFELAEPDDVFAGAGGSLQFRLRTDLPWEVSSDKAWLTFDKEEGVGDGSSIIITATASANESVSRKAVVTVKAGDATKTFEASQKGASFEIVAPASPELPREDGEVLLQVNSSMAWEPETTVEGWSVEKVDATHLKVTTAWNNKFAPKKGVVAIVGDGGLRSEVEFTQDVNFTFEGNYEILSDGSVKLTGGASSRIVSKDSFRYMKVDFEMGEVNFAEKGEIWFAGLIGSAQLYNWLTVGKTRVRLEGTLADGKGARIDKDSYLSVDYSISLEELNAMTSYGIDMVVDSEDESLFYMNFLYNGTGRCSAHARNPFYYAPDEGASFWLGFYTSSTADTWYVVKSCEVSVH